MKVFAVIVLLALAGCAVPNAVPQPHATIAPPPAPHIAL